MRNLIVCSILIVNIGFLHSIEIHKIDKLNCVCDNYYKIYIDSANHEVFITCGNGGFYTMDKDLNSCLAYTINQENRELTDMTKFNNNYFFLAMDIAQPNLGGTNYFSSDLNSFNRFDMVGKIPISYFTFQDQLFTLFFSSLGMGILKFNGSDFDDYTVNNPFALNNILNVNDNYLLGVGAKSDGSGNLIGGIFKSQNGKDWQVVNLDKSYKPFGRAKVFYNKVYVASADGDILKFSLDTKFENSYKLDNNEKIYDFIEIFDENKLIITTYLSDSKIGKLKVLNLETNTIETIFTFNTNEYGREFVRIKDKVYLITNAADIYQLDITTSIIANQREKQGSDKRTISRESLIEKLHKNINTNLYNILGQKINLNNNSNSVFLILELKDKIIIYYSY